LSTFSSMNVLPTPRPVMKLSLAMSCAVRLYFVCDICRSSSTRWLSAFSSDVISASRPRDVGAALTCIVGLFASARASVVSTIENVYGMNRSAPNPCFMSLMHRVAIVLRRRARQRALQRPCRTDTEP
jgi:hypothetical protein